MSKQTFNEGDFSSAFAEASYPYFRGPRLRSHYRIVWNVMLSAPFWFLGCNLDHSILELILNDIMISTQ